MKILTLIIIGLLAVAIFICNDYRQSSAVALKAGTYKVIEKGEFEEAYTAIISPTGFFGKLWMIELNNKDNIQFTYLTVRGDKDGYHVKQINKPGEYPVLVSGDTVSIFYANKTLKLKIRK